MPMTVTQHFKVRKVLKDLVRAISTENLRGVVTAEEIGNDLQAAAVLYIKGLVRDRSTNSAREVRVGIQETTLPAYFTKLITQQVQKQLIVAAQRALDDTVPLDKRQMRRNIRNQVFPRDRLYERPEHIRLRDSMEASEIQIRNASTGQGITNAFGIDSLAPHAALILNQAGTRVVIGPKEVVRQIDQPRRAWMVFRGRDGQFVFIRRPRFRKNASKKALRELSNTAAGKLRLKIVPSLRARSALNEVFKQRAPGIAENVLKRSDVVQKFLQDIQRAHAGAEQYFNQKSPFVERSRS